MYARISTYQGPAGLSDDEVAEIVRRTQENVLPTVRQMTGYRGVLSLLDRGTGKALTMTMWDSKADMESSEEAANATRAQAADIAREQVVGVERYEVTFQDMP
jgi:heme-degrading monooxygenase HmoA